jgi:hypothetical protein
MPKLELLIHASDMDMISGHYTVTASIEETADDGSIVRGVRETFGISFEELQQRFGGDSAKWRDTVVAKALTDRHAIRKGMHYEIISWQNKKFPIDNR